jgi:cholesterol transport system auxiliary component
MKCHSNFAVSWRWLVLATLPWLATGCGSLLESNEPATVNYVLAPAPAADKPTGSVAAEVDLSIGRPDVAPGLDTQRIAVLRGRELDYYRGAQWGGRTAEVVQTLIVGSLQDQRMFRSVTPEQTRVSGEYFLDLEVRDFQAEYRDAAALPAVRVGMVGRLIRVADRQLLATVVASTTRPAKTNSLSEVTAAFESAGQWVALELARQTAAAIATDQNNKRADGKPSVGAEQEAPSR